MRGSGVQRFKGSEANNRVQGVKGSRVQEQQQDPSTPRPLDPSNFLKEAKRLIRISSVTTASNRKIARHVGTLLKRAGCRVRYQRERIGGIPFYNVIGQKGKGHLPLMLMTHLDTVPSGPRRLWTKTGGNPWSPRTIGNRIYGLGSADTKLDILPKIFAAGRIPAGKLRHPLMVIGTFGEERGLLGARAFCRRLKGEKGVAFVSEPTELSWVYAHKGYLVLELTLPLARPSGSSFRKRSRPVRCFEVTATGKSAHSSMPRAGRNAIRTAFRFLKALSRRDRSLRVLSAEGGTSPNQVPDTARLVVASSLETFPREPFIRTRALGIRRGGGERELPWRFLLELFEAVDRGIRERKRPMTSTVGVIQSGRRDLKVYVDFRIPPGDGNGEVLSFFRRRIKRVASRHRLRAGIRIDRDGFALSVSRKAPIIRLAREASRMIGEPFRLIQKPTCTEAGFLWKKGIPALVVGPGRAAGNIHAPNESNDLRQLERAERLYKALIERYCIRG